MTEISSKRDSQPFCGDGDKRTWLMLPIPKPRKRFPYFPALQLDYLQQLLGGAGVDFFDCVGTDRVMRVGFGV